MQEREKQKKTRRRKTDSVRISDEKMKEHDELCYRAAVESAVLLKNEKNLLPLCERSISGEAVFKREDSQANTSKENPAESDLVFIGHMAKELRYQGAGSSHINPWKLTNVLDVYPNAKYVEGCRKDGSTDSDMLEEAAKTAKCAKAVVVFAGLTEKYESEGFDRENMKMPEGHNRLINAVAAVNENIIVVLMCGSPVEMPWEEKVKSILYMGLPGQAGGRAIVDLLFGRANPCGKLAESWPYQYKDCVSSSYYEKKDAHYRESVYVGYRYYESAKVPVHYPFGYGLSYTNFQYSNLLRQGNKVYCMVKNVGNCVGKEIVQLYISAPKDGDSTVYRPIRELKGFKKIFLKPGESKRVSFELDDRSFAVWNDGWTILDGRYQIQIGKNARDIKLFMDIEKRSKKCVKAAGVLAGVTVKHETESVVCENTKMSQIPQWYFSLNGTPSHEDFEQLMGCDIVEKKSKKGEFTMSNSIMEMKDDSGLMKFFYKVVELVISSKFGWKSDYSNPTFRMMMNTAADASLNGMKINVGIKRYIFEGLLEMGNGHFIKGIRKMFEK